MITELNIQNFQSHENSQLQFHPGVNIIIGNSDSGKTAIIRSMRWVLWNRPSGDSIRSNWGGETNVEIISSEGTVVRSKDKVDKYILCISGKREIEFKAFGTSVPEEIIKLLNINEINLQQQLDSPFLLSETSGVVASHFNKVAKLDKIDLATQNINSWIRELTSDIKYAKRQETNLQEELKIFEYLEKMEIDIEVLEGMEKRLTTLRKKEIILQELIYDIQLRETDIKNKSKILKLEEPLNQIFEWKDKIEDIGTEGSELQHIVKQVKEVEKEIGKQRLILAVETNVIYLLKLYKDKGKIDSDYNRLYKLSNSIVQTNRAINVAEERYKELHERFERVFPNRCPLCGTKIK